MKERSVFLAALEIENAERRSAYLREICSDDASLRQSVEELLEASAAVGSFMDTPAATIAAANLKTIAVNPISLAFLAPSDQPGSLGRLGHYEILEVVGCGGFGVVLKARDERLQRIVAIKTLAESLAASAEARKRFVREARAGAAVRHENVVAVYAVEEDGPVPYLVMEFVDGTSLDEELKLEGKLNLTEVQRIGAQVAAGLAAAHQRGLVHRDVKPGNILLEHGTGRVKLTDFGLARAVDDASLSREGLVAGTPEYMSPEQAKGLAIDHRTDLFSLGSVLYAMCTGRPPFSADGSLAVLARLANDTPPPIQTINPQIPSWLSELVARLHAKRPDARFNSADEVAKLLTQAQDELQRTDDSSAPHRIARRGQGVRPWHLALAATVLIATVLAALIVPSAARWGRNKGQIERHPKEEAPTPTVIPSEPVFIPQHRSFQIDHQVVTLAVSPDGRTVAAGSAAYLGNSGPVGAGNFPIVLWDLESNVEKRRLAGHHGAVRGLAFSADGTRLCSASNDRYLKTWNLESGEELSSVRLSPIDVYGLALSSDGRRLLAGCGNRLVRLLDVETGNELWQNGQNTENIGTVALSRDGRIGLTGGRQSWDIDQRQWIPGVDQSLHVWDLNNGQQRQQLSGHTAFVSSAAISADGRRILTGSHDKTIRVWSVETGDPVLSFTVPGMVMSVALSPDGRRALSAGGDTVVRLWDLENSRQLDAFHRHQVPACCVVFGPDGRTALSGSTDGLICIWQLAK